MSEYKKKTPFFGIPIACEGDYILESENIKTFKIIENQLIAATKGIKSCVFEDGDYSLVDNFDGTFSVLLKGNCSQPPVCGLLNGGLIESKKELLWENLETGNVYYLYVKWKPSLYEHPDRFSIVSSKTPRTKFTYLYLAKVDLTAKPLIDTYPDGKVYSTDITLHFTDHTNPHGLNLIQDYLTVRKQSLFELSDKEVKDSPIIIDDKRGTGEASISSTNEMSFKDKRCTLLMSDDNNSELSTKHKTIIGSINESNEKAEVCNANITLHITDNTNPHGLGLTQDYLTVKKRALLELSDKEVKGSPIIIDDKRGTGESSISSTNEMSFKDKRCTLLISDDNNSELNTENKTIIGSINELVKKSDICHYTIDVKSSGANGTKISVDGAKEIINVQISQHFSGDINASIGQVFVGYYGKDKSINSSNECVIYNNGKSELMMRVTVLYRNILTENK